MLKEQKDEDLILLVSQGHKHAFDQLMRRYSIRAFAIASRVCRDRHEVEDIVQEAFIKVWTAAPSWKPGKSKFSTWFYRIIVNTSIDRYRARKFSSPVDWDRFPDPARSAERTMMEDQQNHIVMKAIDSLPERQRLAILLCYQQDLSNQDAADIMNVNLKALESLLVRGRKALKQELRNFKYEVGYVDE